MVAGSNFRHHAAVFRMDMGLGIERMREQTTIAVINGDAGLIAGRFNTQYAHS
jgi:hypothetical protein